jgi:ribonuclease PH
VDCDVIQADGGTRTASITGAFVALSLAVMRLKASAGIAAEAIQSPVAAVSVGIVRGMPMLDLCYEEDSTAEVDFNIVMTGDDAFVEVQGTAEGKPFTRGGMDQLLDLGRDGIRELFALQREAIAKGSQPT